MKVLFLTHYGDRYGANLSMIRLMQNLQTDYGVEPIVILPKKGEIEKILQKIKVPYYKVHYLKWMYDFSKHSAWYIKILRRVQWLYNMKAIYCIRRICRKNGINLIHTNTSVTEIGYKAAIKAKLPHIWHIREYGKEDYNLEYICDLAYIKECYEKTDLLIAISNDIREEIIKVAPSCRCVTIYNGVDICSPYVKHYADKGERLRFCCAGHISQGKNQMALIEAAQVLIQRKQLGFEINIIGGGDDQYMEQMQNKIEEYGLQEYVYIQPYRNNLQDALRSMDVGIIPSIREAFGRITIEYMMHYMPVIGSNTGGTKELINEGENGALFSLDKIDMLADKMQQYIENRRLCVEHGKKARELAEREYDVRINTKKIYGVYHEVLTRQVE